MTCLCLPRVQALIPGLLPAASLRIGLPPILPSLAAVLSMPSAPAGGLSISAALRLGLPPLPLPPLMIDRIAATATAVAQLSAGLGISLLQPQGPARLALSLGSLQLRLPQLLALLAALKLDLNGAMNLALVLSTIANARASFGIDLLAPGAALALKLALSATLGLQAPSPPVSAALAARLSGYARLSLAATSFGGIGRLLPALELLARIRLPVLAWPVGPLASLSLLLGLRDSIRAVLGIDASLPGLQLRLQAALRPLWGLAALQLPAAATARLSLPSLGAGFALDVQALAGLDLAAIATLKLPDLAPVSLVASLSAAAGLASPDCCGSH